MKIPLVVFAMCRLEKVILIALQDCINFCSSCIQVTFGGYITECAVYVVSKYVTEVGLNILSILPHSELEDKLLHNLES